MKIVFIIDHFGNGGAERVVSVLSDMMVRKGHTVSVIVSKDERNYPLNPEIKYLVAKDRSNKKLARRIAKVVTIRGLIRKIEPDAIYSFGYFMNLYSLLATLGMKKSKLIISERTDPNAEPGNAILRRVRNTLYRKADVLVCQTEQAKQYFSISQQRKSVVIPNPIKSDLPARYLGEREKNIVTACRLEKQKNLPMLLKAFAEVKKCYPEYRLTIYGDGSLRNELIDQCEILGIKDSVSFPGFQANIHEKIVDSCMYVSSSDYEGISNSMLEAMGMGLPVICTDCPVGGAAMAIKHKENGLLIPVGNLEELVKAMEFIISHPRAGEQYGSEAMYVKTEFDVNKICDKWIGLIYM